VALPRRLTAACLAAALVLGTLAGGPALAAPPCATDREAEALRVRALQSKLMVAALACGDHGRYDAFIERFEQTLSVEGRVMVDYFARRHGGKRISRVVDDYVTTQANQHSLDSMTNRSDFCQDASQTFDSLMAGDHETLRLASASIPDHRIESSLACLRVASRAPAKPSAP